MTNRPSRSNPVQDACLLILTAIALTAAVYWLRSVLIPFVVALFIVSGITPILDFLQARLNVNRIVAAGVTFALAIGGTFLVGMSIWLSMAQMSEEGKLYRMRVSEIVSNAEDWLHENVAERFESSEVGERSEAAVADLVEESEATVVPAERQEPDELLANAAADLRDQLEAFLRNAVATLSSELFQLGSTSIVILIYVFFLLLGNLSGYGENTLAYQVDRQVRSYLFVKTMISLATGIVFGMALWLFGVPMALTFGLLAFLLNYIPNIGPILASILPLPFILLHPDGSMLWMIIAIAVTCSIQVASGNLLEPKLMGNSADLHPVVILLALMFWGTLWGITGMFLATPITAAIKIALDRMDVTRPVARVMAGRLGPKANDSIATS
ncbi:putative membrane protein-putative a permease [Rhodopirellula baltica SH 1]|uniref:Membrane protein-putative a permease n=1 Tax=Rhodopirellula baltica (strain DSM 10527 / NCIMB 13988 / SH1) TaxID=243090 RepID=Q7ULF1_RHOBA|nr:putative membrane protein-putative a permease [Rhodopirellula baltica SH 1]